MSNPLIALYPDMFNDVFGPIMQPGSSSHTAAPCRLGNMARSILGEELKKVTVLLDKEGSFAGTFGSMREHLGMLGGTLGISIDDERLFDAVEIAEKDNVEYEFIFGEMRESTHINGMKYILTGTGGKVTTLVGDSIGGGMVETVSINGYPLRDHGDTYMVLVYDPQKNISASSVFENARAKWKVIGEGTVKTEERGNLYYIKISEPVDIGVLGDIQNISDIDVMAPVLPVISTAQKKPQLFSTVTEWRRLAEEQGKSLYEVSIDYQSNSTSWQREKIIDYMKWIAQKMHMQTHASIMGGHEILETPFSGYHYKKWIAYADGSLTNGVIGDAIKYAFAASENFRGVHIVPGPMGLGGGYVYAALCAVMDHFNYTEEDLLRGLFIAGGIGAIAYTRTHPTGEVIGCTGECGVCCSMAAAAVTEMCGGTPGQVEAAASLALQACLGWPCDPIPGGQFQPCMSRVITATTTAIAFADIALSGKDAVMPYHEVVDVADKIGRGLSNDLLCTSRGGCCESASGKACINNFKQYCENKR